MTRARTVDIDARNTALDNTALDRVNDLLDDLVLAFSTLDRPERREFWNTNAGTRSKRRKFKDIDGKIELLELRE